MSFFLALFISAFSAHGDAISENFSTRSAFVSGTAIWNQALGVVHPTLQVMNYKPGFSPLAVDIGDGSHGSFDISTYANFSVGGDISGNIIRLDLATYPILKVTTFHLAPTWRIEPVGDQPVIIYSMSDVTIEGEIHCEGQSGTNAVGTTPGVGGQGRCGGLEGGDGAPQFGNGTNGGDASGLVTGGSAGNDTDAAATVGGGGGGGWNNTSPAGDGVNAFGPFGGFGGANDPDPEFTQLIGGAGGGGGGGNDNFAGAGGGGGGGVVIIHAARDFNIGTSPSSATGFIYANGGGGGSSNVAGGPGGGGAGGAVKVFVGRTINIYNTGAASQADGGVGGTNSLAVPTANGASGRSWFSSVNYVATTGFYTPSEEAPVTPGNVEFISTTQSVETASVDLLQSLAEVTALNVSPASADFLFEAAGSDDNFISDTTGWTTNLISLSHKRYLKMRISITTSDVNNPTMVDSVTLNYDSMARTNFKLEAAGCGRVQRTGASTPDAALPITTLLLFFLYLKLPAEPRKR